MNVGLSNQDSRILIDRGVECNAEYTYTKGKDKSKVKIIKEESNDLTYKVSITYHGLDNSRPDWTVYINDKIPTMDKKNLSYHGSKVFVFKPVDKEMIEVQETDEHETASLWIDLSGEKYEVHNTLPVVCEKIQVLIEKGKIFKPADDKEVKKIFYSRYSGVFLYARDKNWSSDIYHAKGDEEFSKCQSKMMSQCRCPVGDSKWEVKLATENASHILEFPQGSMEFQGGHGNNVLWDNTSLKNITL